MNTTNIVLRDYQQEMKARLFAAWRQYQSVMVQMPTGTGKTHVLASVIKDFLQNRASESDGCVWIVAHRRELVAQIEETIERYGVDKKEGTVKAMSIQWLIRHWEDTEIVPLLIVIDEAHHALADSYKELWVRYPKAKKLGMTATPCRMNRTGFTELFEVLLTSWNIVEFIRKGVLSLFDYVSIRPDSEEQRLINSLEKRGADGDYQLKEMDAVLNRRPSIERLYQSFDKFAHNKKGIVYAISISHARGIAEYYCKQGVSAVAIDSRTPAVERKRFVKDFKSGNIDVLVNVDVFSEGFDCPDVEFIQMARPTLSLAKYLQQVGRGLRMSADKRTCILIDNVGLYNVFGLPVVSWDWKSMFCGDVAGKGSSFRKPYSNLAHYDFANSENARHGDMEMIVSHDNLLDFACDIRNVSNPAQKRMEQELQVRRDAESGLWILERGRGQSVGTRYITVFGTKYGMAAVRFIDMTCGLVNNTGDVVWKTSRCQFIKFLAGHLLNVITSDGQECYLDLYSLHAYDRKPEIKKFGNIELLKIGPAYYSRTKSIYVNNQNVDRRFIAQHKFYLTIFDYKMPISNLERTNNSIDYRCGYACLFENDYDRYYWLYRWLPDGSIIVKDDDGRYYHVEAEKGKMYIGCENSAHDISSCILEIEHLESQAKERERIAEEEKTNSRQVVLNSNVDAIPFKTGLKWGLKVGNRITIPPIYRNIESPVGRFCAVEKNYNQWGVVAIDGTILVEPKYPKIAINDNGTALLTSVTGKCVLVKL